MTAARGVSGAAAADGDIAEWEERRDAEITEMRERFVALRGSIRQRLSEPFALAADEDDDDDDDKTTEADADRDGNRSSAEGAGMQAADREAPETPMAPLPMAQLSVATAAAVPFPISVAPQGGAGAVAEAALLPGTPALGRMLSAPVAAAPSNHHLAAQRPILERWALEAVGAHALALHYSRPGAMCACCSTHTHACACTLPHAVRHWSRKRMRLPSPSDPCATRFAELSFRRRRRRRRRIVQRRPSHL